MSSSPCLPELPRFKVMVTDHNDVNHALVIKGSRLDQGCITIADVKAALAKNDSCLAAGLSDPSIVYEAFEQDFKVFVVVNELTQLSHLTKLRVKRDNGLEIAKSVSRSASIVSSNSPRKTNGVSTRISRGLYLPSDDWLACQVNPPVPTYFPETLSLDLQTLSRLSLTFRAAAKSATKSTVINTRHDLPNSPSVTIPPNQKFLRLLDATVKNTSMFKDPKLSHSAAWKFVADDLNRNLNQGDEPWTSSRCSNTFTSQLGFYFNALKKFNNSKDAQASWPLFDRFHNKLDLNALCDKSFKFKVQTYRDEFSSKMNKKKQTGNLKSEGKSVQKKSVEPSTSKVNENQTKLLIDSIIKHNADFQNPALTNLTVWELVSQSLRGKIVMWSGAECKRHFDSQVIGGYLRVLKKCKDSKAAQSSWSHFNRVHSNLALAAICDQERFNMVQNARQQFTKPKIMHAKGTPLLRSQDYSIDSQLSVSVVDADRELLKSILKEQHRLVKNPDNFWLRVVADLNMKQLGKTFEVQNCEARFYNLLNLFISTMRKDIESQFVNKLPQWLFFNEFYYLLDLEFLVPDEELEIINELMFTWGHLPELLPPANCAQPLLANRTTEHPKETVCEKTVLLNAVKKFQHRFNDITIPKDTVWKEVSTEMSRHGVQVPPKSCCMKFVTGLLNLYTQCLMKHGDVIKASAAFPFFDTFHFELDLNAICLPNEMKKVATARESFANGSLASRPHKNSKVARHKAQPESAKVFEEHVSDKIVATRREVSKESRADLEHTLLLKTEHFAVPLPIESVTDHSSQLLESEHKCEKADEVTAPFAHSVPFQTQDEPVHQLKPYAKTITTPASASSNGHSSALPRKQKKDDKCSIS